MKSNLQVFCENWEALLKKDSSVKKEQVFVESDLMYELLVPRSRERYDGVKRNFFGFAEWKHQLDDDVFFNLIEQERIAFEPDRVIAYLKRLLDVIQKEVQSFPSIYFLEGADGGKKSSLLAQYDFSNSKVSAGYDLCMVETNGVWRDLRGQKSIEGLDRDGVKKTVKIAQRTIEEVFGEQFRSLLGVAETAKAKGVRVVITAHHYREELVQPISPTEKSESSESLSQADEEQIKRYMKMVEEIPIPVADEEEELVRNMELFGEEGAAARTRLCQGYFRLVLSLATKYLERGVRLLDLIPQANRALTFAVEQYDYACGVPFSQYATWQIESALQHYLGEVEIGADLPAAMAKKLEQVKEVSEKLRKEKKRPPTEQEIATAMGIDVEQLRRLFEQV